MIVTKDFLFLRHEHLFICNERAPERSIEAGERGNLERIKFCIDLKYAFVERCLEVACGWGAPPHLEALPGRFLEDCPGPHSPSNSFRFTPPIIFHSHDRIFPCINWLKITFCRELRHNDSLFQNIDFMNYITSMQCENSADKIVKIQIHLIKILKINNLKICTMWKSLQFIYIEAYIRFSISPLMETTNTYFKLIQLNQNL